MTRQWSLRTILTRNARFRLCWSSLWNHSRASLTASQLKTPGCISADWAWHAVWAETKPTHTTGRQATQAQSNQRLNSSQNRECFSIHTDSFKDPRYLGFIFCHQELFSFSFVPSTHPEGGFEAFGDLGLLANSADFSSFPHWASGLTWEVQFVYKDVSDVKLCRQTKNKLKMMSDSGPGGSDWGKQTLWTFIVLTLEQRHKH